MILVLLGILIVVSFYYYCIKPLSYWKDRGVPQTEPMWFFGDSWRSFGKEGIIGALEYLYYGPGDGRYAGHYNFTYPVLNIKDAELTKKILVKDFDHFVDHYIFQSSESDPLWSNILIALKGNKWREMRSILSPCFTSSKMRAMFPLMAGCADRFTKHFLSLNEQVVSVEMKDTFTRFATDVIASTAFGVEVDSLEQPENTFYVMGKRATTFDFWKIVRFFINVLAPKLNALLGLRILDKETLDFFVELVDQTIKTREEKGIVRPDMIHLLMEARKGKMKNEESGKDEPSAHIIGGTQDKTLNSITNMEIAAQAMIFFFGGFETSSNLMSFMAYELAAHKDVQDRLRKEIEDTSNECNGKLTYEALLRMKYMDMVVSETLRKWPVNLVVDRECTKPYTIEPALPEEKPVHLEKGSYVSVMIYCIHRDPRYFPRPNVFDPERFSSENVDKIQPYTYLPFGVGPRSCIGSRFALLETKALFFYLLSSFEIVLTEKSCKSIVLTNRGINIMIKGGNWLGLRALRK